jgi:hypothetical protein
MKADPQFFMVWAHRGAESIFGPTSKPVIRNGAFLCFDNEERARAECDRLNAGLGAAHVHYTVKPAHAQALKQVAEDFSLHPTLSTSPCAAGERRTGASVRAALARRP